MNGALILRHELGHSIIEIGEEYDGSPVDGYFGINSADTPESVGWTDWLTDPPTSSPSNSVDNAQSSSTPRVERMVMSLQQYPWTILNTTYSAKFHSAGTVIFFPINYLDPNTLI